MLQLWYMEEDVEKAHKYIKRVPTGKPKPKYRYFYKMPKGGLVTKQDLVVGSSFQYGSGEERSHYSIKKVEGDSITVSHSDSKETRTVSFAQLKDLLDTDRLEQAAPKEKQSSQESDSQEKQQGDAKEEQDGDATDAKEEDKPYSREQLERVVQEARENNEDDLIEKINEWMNANEEITESKIARWRKDTFTSWRQALRQFTQANVSEQEITKAKEKIKKAQTYANKQDVFALGKRKLRKSVSKKALGKALDPEKLFVGLSSSSTLVSRAIKDAYKDALEKDSDGGWSEYKMRLLRHMIFAQADFSRDYIETIGLCLITSVEPPKYKDFVKEYAKYPSSHKNVSLTSNSGFLSDKKAADFYEQILLFDNAKDLLTASGITEFVDKQGQEITEESDPERARQIKRIAGSLEVLRLAGARPRLSDFSLSKVIERKGRGLSFVIENNEDSEVGGFYDPNKKALHLTQSEKSVVHELWHALDDKTYDRGFVSQEILKEDGNKTGAFISSLRDVISEQVKHLTQEPTFEFDMRGSKYEKEKTLRAYYASPVEVFARFGEQYSAYKLMEAVARGKIPIFLMDLCRAGEAYKDLLDRPQFLPHDEFMRHKEMFESVANADFSQYKNSFEALSKSLWTGYSKGFLVVYPREESSNV